MRYALACVPVSWSFERNGLIRLTFTGEWVSDAASREAARAVQESGCWNEDARILLDLSGMVASSVPSAGVLRARTERWLSLGPTPKRMAIVAAPGAIFGISRMIEGFTGPLSDRIHTFDDSTEALVWLAAD